MLAASTHPQFTVQVFDVILSPQLSVHNVYDLG
jgi:hypothetical protein